MRVVAGEFGLVMSVHFLGETDDCAAAFYLLRFFGS